MEKNYDVSTFKKVKYNLLQFLPGRKGLYYQRKVRRANYHKTQAEFTAALEATRGQVAIDLGANVGEFSTRLAETASRVYAFEPDPVTADVLRKNLAGHANIEVIEAAISDQSGTGQIFRARDYSSNPEEWWQASSLIADSALVAGTEAAATVKTVSFVDFIRSLDTDIGVVKMDIEGSEIEVLDALFDSDILDRIGYVFCETHETELPHLAGRYRDLRARAKQIARPVVNLDWH